MDNNMMVQMARWSRYLQPFHQYFSHFVKVILDQWDLGGGRGNGWDDDDDDDDDDEII